MYNMKIISINKSRKMKLHIIEREKERNNCVYNIIVYKIFMYYHQFKRYVTNKNKRIRNGSFSFANRKCVALLFSREPWSNEARDVIR